MDKIAGAYRYKHPFTRSRLDSLYGSIFKKITRKALPLFFRGGDIISVAPLTRGVYEAEIKALLEHFAANDHADFLIDIGANIGLSSCQSGRQFSVVHMYEPNPDCLAILKVNTRIALQGMETHIHEFGLGLERGRLKLHIPRANWGGAFILSDDNQYDMDLLSAKDGNQSLDAGDYDVVDVMVEPAVEAMAALFAELELSGKRRGAVKIDIEGFEKLVIAAILAVLPKGFDLFVVFENLKGDIDLQALIGNAPGRTALFRLSKNKRPLPQAPRFVNRLVNIARGGFTTTLVPVAGEFRPGIYVMRAAGGDVAAQDP